MSDSSSTAANNTIATTTGVLTSTSIGGTAVTFGTDDLTSTDNATTALHDINTAIAAVASLRGTVGANINQLQAASNVMGTRCRT